MKLLTTYFLLLFSIFATVAQAQELNNRITNIGLELQQYPTGYMIAGHGEIGWNKRHSIDFRAGYNGLDHLSFGPNDEEIGGGPGFSVGYNYYFGKNFQKWLISYRTDLWWNEVHWANEIGEINETKGQTNVVVLQPTLIGAYVFLFKEHFIFTPTLAVGMEINIITEGKPVGEGAIILWGAKLAYRL